MLPLIALLPLLLKYGPPAIKAAQAAAVVYHLVKKPKPIKKEIK